MAYTLLNEQFEAVDVVETFESFLWTDRYYEAGDFELYTSASTSVYNTFKEDMYLESSESDRLMLIEDKELTSTEENGSFFSITGRSVESILDRRIIWFQTNLVGNLQNGIKKLLDENAISPSDTKRKIPGLVFEASTDPAITSLTIEAQYLGDNLYDSIVDICVAYEIGFRIIRRDSSLVFKLYSGADKSYDQTTNSYIIFSPDFDNLTKGRFFYSKRPLKTDARVGGEGEGSDKKFVTVTNTTAKSGLERREMYIESSISSKSGGATLTTAQYNAQLTQKGKEVLANAQTTLTVDGEIAVQKSLVYGVDFSIGDIVQMETEHGMTGRSRITEYIHSESSAGTSEFPTLQTIHV